MQRILSRWFLAATVAGFAPVLAQPTAPYATPPSAYIVQSHGTQSAVRPRQRCWRSHHTRPAHHPRRVGDAPPRAGRPLAPTGDRRPARRRLRSRRRIYSDSYRQEHLLQEHLLQEQLPQQQLPQQQLPSSSSPSSSSDASTVPNQDARAEIGADRLAAQGFNGTGVAVAVLDSGLPSSWVQYARTRTWGSSSTAPTAALSRTRAVTARTSPPSWPIRSAR